MEQSKRAHKKVGQKKSKMLEGVKVLSNSIYEILPEMVGIMDDQLEEARSSIRNMKVAIWALVIYQVILTVSFLLVLYGNQFLVR